MSALAPCEWREAWPWIEPHIARILERAGDRRYPQDVCDQLDSGDAHLLTGDKEFLIFKLATIRGERTLWVWLAYGEIAGFLERHKNQMVTIALDCGATNIRFNSTRRGFMRALGKQWKARNVTYEWRIR